MKRFIPFALHEIGADDIREVVSTLKSDWITTGPKVKLFEDNFSEYIGTKHAVAVNSATAGLHLALECIGLGAGDKVITTPYTFTATAEVIRYFGADPIFVDIREEDYNIDPLRIDEFCRRECQFRNGVLRHKPDAAAVKAIMPVHVGGRPCRMDEIMEIARRYNLKVIEDAAHALPSFYKDRKIGTLSDLTVFSFYATKPITTAEGGMVVTCNKEYQKRMNTMRLHGMDREVWDRYTGKRAKWKYRIVGAGFKYNMTDIAASLGIKQLEKIGLFHEKRKKIAAIYNTELKNMKEVELPLPDSDSSLSSWHLYIIRLKSGRVSRDDFIERLYRKGIGTSVHFIPLHIQPYYRKRYHFKPADFPVAYRCFKSSVSLPIYTRLSEKDVLKVAGTIKGILL